MPREWDARTGKYWKTDELDKLRKTKRFQRLFGNYGRYVAIIWPGYKTRTLRPSPVVRRRATGTVGTTSRCRHTVPGTDNTRRIVELPAGFTRHSFHSCDNLPANSRKRTFFVVRVDRRSGK